MKYLLDVNVLLAAIHQSHSAHAKTVAWLEHKQIVLCPLAELGFLRISSNPRALAVPMPAARSALSAFTKEHKADWIADDLRGLDAKADKSEQVTDHYLSALAGKHGHKLATLDEGIKLASVELVR